MTTETTAPAILVVEDEALIRMLAEDALAEAGFAVTTAPSGADAIALLDEKGDEVRVLVTDIRLGAGVDGWAVARRARELNASVGVVYITGDSEAGWASMGVPKSVLVAKPFVAAQLITAVSQLLIATDTGL